jgi:mono/diheme cytochrome c family protein
MFQTFPLVRFCLAAVAGGLTAAAARGQDLQYNRDIRPILTENCFKCHGPAAKKGGFRLDVREDAIKPAKSKRTPIVPGKPDESELIKRITSKDPEDVMPPPSAHKVLKAGEMEALKKWIAQGAVYQKHWSFEAPAKVALPRNDVKNPIDAFILDRLKREGLKMSPEADRPTLIRRVAFALTGLPPTLSEVDLYLKECDSATPQTAYEKMVDRYLASKHYGEEMARHWLATPTRMDCTSTTSGRCGSIATGSFAPSTTTCRSTASRSSSSPAICCRRRRASRSSRPASTAVTSRPARAAPLTRSGSSATPSIGPRRRWKSSWA